MSEQKWGSATQYWLGVIGFAVGYGNIWRFPYFLFTFGGPAFLIPYTFALFFLGIPTMLLQSTIGQMLGQPVAVFKNIHIKFKGIAVSAMIIFLLVSQYYVVLIAWTLQFLVYSFFNPLPWTQENDGNPWNQQFFQQEVLETSDGIQDTSQIKWHLVLSLFAGWVLTYLCIWKGIKGAGKILYVTAPLPYLLLFCLLIRGLTLQGAEEGLKYLVTFQWEEVFSLTTWRFACNQILYSLGVGAGGMVLFASCRQKNEKVISPSKLLPIINSGTSLLACITIYTFIGHMSVKEDLEIDDLPIDGPKLAFVAYPISLGLMPGSAFWSVLFFLMLLMLGLDSQFTMVETFLSFLESEGLSRFNREINALIYCVVSFLFGLIFALDSGQYILYLFDRYVSSISLFLIVTLEFIVIVWVFGIDKLSEILNENTGEEISKYFRFVLRYITPVITGLLLVMAFISEILDPLDYPWWAILIGWCISIITISPIFYYAVFGKQIDDVREVELQGKMGFVGDEMVDIEINEENQN